MCAVVEKNCVETFNFCFYETAFPYLVVKKYFSLEYQNNYLYEMTQTLADVILKSLEIMNENDKSKVSRRVEYNPFLNSLPVALFGLQ